MAKRQNPAAPNRKKPQDSGPSNSEPHEKYRESWRDTLESVVFAFVLAFLFRTFEAEAFVIPTGSMAPTLYGRHKEFHCQQCGFPIVIGASDEVDSDTGQLKGFIGRDGHLVDGVQIRTAICPNCRFENPDIQDLLPFNGDRILVNKYPYEFGEPDRFDVFVFKWPEKPETNYIKRLVGLPNETIRIRQGDVYRWDEQQRTEQILRKADPDKQRVLQLPVYNDNYPPQGALAEIWPNRWAGMRQAGLQLGLAGWADDTDAWQLADEDGQRSYRQNISDALTWLRYRNFVPAPDDWRKVEAGLPVEPHPQLVTDFCGYNAYMAIGQGGRIDYGPYWVPDLTVSFEIEIDEVADGGELLLELVEGIYRYRCRINLQTGQAELFHLNVLHGEDDERNLLTANCGIDGPGTYDVRFANVDDRLCLWVDGSVIDFGPEAAYERKALDNNLPTDADLTPVGIAVRGASARVSDLFLERDIYYRAESRARQIRSAEFQDQLAEVIDDPQTWGAVYTDHMDLDTIDLKIDADHFLALGDNSPRSSDSRLWLPGMQTVPREFLVGKAFFIYWPHGVPFLNDGRGFTIVDNKAYSPQSGGYVSVEGSPKYAIPFYPQVTRMKRIR